MPQISDPQEIAAHFQLDGRFVSAQRFGSGHINDTFLVDVEGNPAASHFILQHVNKHVFGNPEALMENISRVTEHLGTRNARCPALIPTNDGECFYKSPDDEYWRMYEYIPDAVAYDSVQNTGQAKDTAAMFGGFQKLLTDLPGPRLNETIPDFHNTPVRYSQFHAAVTEDAFDRVRHCQEEIDRALSWEADAGTIAILYENGQLPERIIHNDTKLNNLLFERISGNPICVIDLDTVMPGVALYDFGDMVRTATSPTTEDTSDLSNIRLRLPYYQALVEGYIGATSGFLTEPEIEHLSMSGKVITIETGLRFLTDYLCGDGYFGSQRPAQNLDRSRTQFALASSIEEQFNEMQEIVNRAQMRR